MYFHLKKALLMPALLGLSLFTIEATAESFQITDFRFGMEDPSFSTWRTSSGATPIDPTQYGILVEGTYQGSNSTNALINFNFFNAEVHVSTNSVNDGTTNTPAGSISGGPAPTIDRVGLTADMSSWFAEWNGTDFNQGNNTNFTACDTPSPSNGFSASPNAGLLSSIATVTDNFDGSYRVNWNSCITGGAFNGKVGFWQLDVTCTTCPPSQLGRTDILTAKQNGGPNTQTATINGGSVVIQSSHGTSPANFTFLWESSDSGITDTDGDTTDGNFSFNPSGRAEGNYIFTTSYKDLNTTPETKGKGEIIIRLVSTAVGDIDDSNNNGIQNKDDASLASTQLQVELGTNNTSAIETSTGSLRLGKTAFCAGKAARITKEDFEAYASANCETMNNSNDNLLKETGIGAYYDFEITGLALGETADIVIPLTATIPNSAVYRKYTEQSGWSTFITEGNDKLSSASSTSPGVCPSPTSTAYTSGLTTGDDCVRLSITDGGPNDGDRSANGLIKDPGAVAAINSGIEANLSSGCSITTNANAQDHAEWLLVAGFIALLGWFKMSRRKA